MGRKRTWKRQFILFCVAGLIFFSCCSCATSKKEVTLKEEGPASKGPKLEEQRDPALEHLRRANILLIQGDYEGALKEDQRALALSRKNSPGDGALFHMALICAHFGNPQKDYEKAFLFFQRLMKEYPRSPWVEEAKVWMAVLQENQKLREVIEKSKEVDIAVEKKKREKEK